MKHWNAFVRAFRTFVQGAVTVGAFAAWEAVWTAWQGGTYNARLLTMAGLTALVGAVVTYVYNIISPKIGMGDRSLSTDALLRAGRTIIQTVVAVGLVAGWDSVYATVTGGNYNPRDVTVAAVAAVSTAVISYLHGLIQPAQIQVRPVH